MTKISERDLVKMLADNPDLREAQRTRPSASAPRGLLLPLTLTLEGERPPSRNVTMRLHWSKRRLLYQGITARMHAVLAQSDAFGRPPAARKVRVTVRVYFRNRPLDVDNVDIKPYIDSLKGVIVIDDSPVYVDSRVEVLIDKTRPRTEVIIR